MDLWDIESRISGLTTGSCETLDDLDLIPLDHDSHNAYRSSNDILGLEVPSMELWDESYGPHDGFGFFGGRDNQTNKKSHTKDDSSSSGIHCDEDQELRKSSHKNGLACPARIKQVKSVDDYTQNSPPDGSTTVPQRPPRPAQTQHQRRYRKRTKHGRYATVDITYAPPKTDTEKSEKVVRDAEEEAFSFQRQTFKTRSLNIIVREDDTTDRGSVTNLFVDRCEGSAPSSSSSKQQQQQSKKHTHKHYLGEESVFPYSGGGKLSNSLSCDDLSPSSTQSRNSAYNNEPEDYGYQNTNFKGKTGNSRLRLFTATGSLSRASRTKENYQSCASLTAFVPDPANTRDLKTLTNVKVIAIKSYSAELGHELSFKKGQKLKLKSHSMDGNFGYGWKKHSLLGGKKYGYFPLSHVSFYERPEK